MKKFNIDDELLTNIEEDKDFLIIGIHAKLDMLLDSINDIRNKINNIELKIAKTNNIDCKINLWKNSWKQ